MTRSDHADRIVGETQHVQLLDRDGWSFVRRNSGTGVVCIVAETNDDQIVLVEQPRPPVGRQVIELPAGLVGDLDHQPSESVREAAERELAEETGYEADHYERLIEIASCPGLTDETVTLYLARGLRRIGPGGGDATEEITVHVIPLAQVDDWLRQQADAGKLIDARVYGGLYLLQQYRGQG